MGTEKLINNSTKKFVLIPQQLWDRYSSLEVTNKNVQLDTTKTVSSTEEQTPTNSIFVKQKEEKIEKSIPQTQKVELDGTEDQKLEETVNGEKTEQLKKFFMLKIKTNGYKKKILQELFKSDAIKFSNDLTIIANNVDTNIPVLSFIDTIRSSKKRAFTDLHQLVLNTVNIPSHLIVNPNAIKNEQIKKSDQEKIGWVPFTF